MVPIDVASLEEELEQHNDQISLLLQQSQSLSEEREELSQQYDEQKNEQDMAGVRSKEILDKMELIKVQCTHLCRSLSVRMCYKHGVWFRVN
jgi:chromosome segregation ATPase